MYKLSSKLRNLILKTDIEIIFGGNSHSPPTEIILSISLLSIEVLSEIISWGNKAKKVGIIDAGEYKADVGPFLGVFPVNVEIREDMDSRSGEITFSIDFIDYKWYDSWKSWFIIEE